MLLKYFLAYYHYLWLLLFAVVGIKILISFLFNTNLEGFNGLIYSIFKWYGENSQEMAETANARTMMRLCNVLTLGMYLVLGFIIIVSLLPMFFSA